MTGDFEVKTFSAYKAGDQQSSRRLGLVSVISAEETVVVVRTTNWGNAAAWSGRRYYRQRATGVEESADESMFHGLKLVQLTPQFQRLGVDGPCRPQGPVLRGLGSVDAQKRPVGHRNRWTAVPACRPRQRPGPGRSRWEAD